MPCSPSASANAEGVSGCPDAFVSSRSSPTLRVVVKNVALTPVVFAVACNRAPQVNHASRSGSHAHSSHTYPTRVLPVAPSPIRFQCIVRSDVPKVESRFGFRLASNRNGSSSSSAFDLPVPFGPRSSTRPSWKENTSS